jgi:hypothetical protein
MSDDLVKRLRIGIHTSADEQVLRDEAADRIEKLVEENGVLFAANVRLNSRADLDSDGYADRIKKLENRCANLLVGNCALNIHIEKLEAALHEIAKLNNRRDRFSSEIDAVIVNVLEEYK